MNFDVKNSNVKNSNVKNSNVKNSNVKNSNVKNSNVKNSNVKNSNVKNSNVKNSNVKNSNVKNSNVKNSNVKNSNVKNSNVKNSNVTNSNVNDSNSDTTISFFFFLITAFFRKQLIYYTCEFACKPRAGYHFQSAVSGTLLHSHLAGKLQRRGSRRLQKCLFCVFSPFVLHRLGTGLGHIRNPSRWSTVFVGSGICTQEHLIMRLTL